MSLTPNTLQAEHDELVATLESALRVLKGGGCLTADYRAAKLTLFDATAMADQLGKAQYYAACDADVARCKADARALKGY